MISCVLLHLHLFPMMSSVIVLIISIIQFILPVHAQCSIPPTPPVVASPSPSPAPMRQRAMAQLWPVSIPDIVGHMAGKDSAQKIADFDRHYMPDGLPAPDAVASGNADAHRSERRMVYPKVSVRFLLT
jgi:hypothetical protein